MKKFNSNTVEYHQFFKSASSAAEIFTRLSMSERLAHGLKIWIQVVYHDGNWGTCLNKSSNWIVDKKELTDGSLLLDLARDVGRKHRERIGGHLLISLSTQEKIYRIIGIGESIFWDKLASKFIEKCYPEVVRIFYRQKELRDILLGFEKAIERRLNLTVKDLTIKERRTKTARTEKNNEVFDSERKWTEASLHEAFNEAIERGQWFKSLRMELSKIEHKQPVASIRLTKYGLLSQDHLFELSEHSLLPALEEIAIAKMKLFSKRGLLERNYDPSKPLMISYSSDMFDNKSNVRKLVRTIKSYPNSSKAIYHGNPYLHASLADFIDGSSYEVWVLSPRRILIVPQAKTSAQSLEKFTAFIFDKFFEGELSEYNNV